MLVEATFPRVLLPVLLVRPPWAGLVCASVPVYKSIQRRRFFFGHYMYPFLPCIFAYLVNLSDKTASLSVFSIISVTVSHILLFSLPCVYPVYCLLSQSLRPHYALIISP